MPFVQPLYLPTYVILRFWFGEDLKNHSEGDNQGQVILGDPGAVSRVGRKGATKVRTLSLVLENFRLAFSPDPTDCPWVSEDGIESASHVL